ncbi:unnamed protein product, partial [Mesorhabditis spiculigera]
MLTDATKSPLALLAKTCETIGMPETPVHKKSKKDDSPDGKKSDSPAPKRANGQRSPKMAAKHSAVDPMTAMGLPKGGHPGMFPPFGFPMGLPMSFPGMMAYPPMGYPGFPMPPYMRCPSMMLGRPCTNPASCPGCSGAASGGQDASALAALASGFPGMSPFGFPFMPTTSTATSLPASYQQMLQAAAAASQATTVSLPSSTSMPSSLPSSSTASSTPSTPSPSQHRCYWALPGAGPCNKAFTSAELLNSHIKAAHTSDSPPPKNKSPSPANTTSVSTTSTPASSTASTASSRYHPYSKPQTTTPTSAAASPMAFPFPAMGGMSFPAAALQQMQMYQQKMMMGLQQHP